MRTEDLASFLARQAGPVPRRIWMRRYSMAILSGGVAAAALMSATIRVNSALASALLLPQFWTKVAFAFLMTCAACVMSVRLSRPGARLGLAPLGLMVPLGAVWLGALAALALAEPGEASDLIFGETWLVCPFLIAMLSLPILVAVTWAARGLAPTSLRLAGALGGLLSGAIATLIYCFHCPEMEIPFIAIWYVAGMAIPTVLGALMGPKILRW